MEPALPSVHPIFHSFRDISLASILMCGLILLGPLPAFAAVDDAKPSQAKPAAINKILDEAFPTLPGGSLAEIDPGTLDIEAEIARLSRRVAAARAKRTSSLFSGGIAGSLSPIWISLLAIFPVVAKGFFLAPIFLAWTGLWFLKARRPAIYQRFKLPALLLAVVTTLSTAVTTMASDETSDRIQLVNRLYGLSPLDRAIVLLEEADRPIKLPRFQYEFSWLKVGRTVRPDTSDYHFALVELLVAARRSKDASRHAGKAAGFVPRRNISQQEQLLDWAVRRSDKEVAALTAARLIDSHGSNIKPLLAVGDRVTQLAPEQARKAVSAVVIAGADPSSNLLGVDILRKAGFSADARNILARTLSTIRDRDLKPAEALITLLDARDLVDPFVKRGLALGRSSERALSLASFALRLGNPDVADAALLKAGQRSRNMDQRLEVIDFTIARDRHQVALSIIGELVVKDRSLVFIPVTRPKGIRPFEGRIAEAGKISLAVLAAQLQELKGNLEGAESWMIEALDSRLKSVLGDYVDLDGSLAEYAIVYDFLERTGRSPQLLPSLRALILNCAGVTACSGFTASAEPDIVTAVRVPAAQDHRRVAELKRALLKERVLNFNDVLLNVLRVIILIVALAIAVILAWVDARHLVRMRTLFFVLRAGENIGWIGALSIVLALHGLLLVLTAQFATSQIYQCQQLRIREKLGLVRVAPAEADRSAA